MNRMRLPALALAAAAALTACGDTTGPDRDEAFDAQAALADYQALEGVLGSDAWNALGRLDGAGPFSALRASPSSVTGGLKTLSPTATVAERSEAIRSLADGMRSWSRSPIISEQNRGTTFVYDADRSDYVPDPDRTDAPDNGVRFILYEEVDGQPDPSREIGYADLLDEGDGSEEDIVLRLVAVQHDLEVLNYRTSLTDTGIRAGVITVDGFLQNETERLDFGINVQGDDQTVELGFEIRMDARDFEIIGAVQGTEGEGGPGAVDLTVRHGDESLGVDLESDGETLSGVIRLNGEDFATASGDADDPTFTSADGDALTLTEIGVLIQVFGVSQEVFVLTGGLLAPVAGLVALGIVL